LAPICEFDNSAEVSIAAIERRVRFLTPEDPVVFMMTWVGVPWLIAVARAAVSTGVSHWSPISITEVFMTRVGYLYIL
jgi:hypothetical protein